MNVRKTVVRIAGPTIGAAILATAIGMGTANASTTAPWVREGSRGLGAECVQAGLDYDKFNVAIDGIDGSQTTAAVKVFQRNHGLAADGVVGPATGNLLWGLINRDQNQFTTPYFFCYNKLPTSY